MVNFVYHHLECTSNYRPLSYPFRSLGQKKDRQTPTTIQQYINYRVASLLTKIRILKLIVDCEATGNKADASKGKQGF